MLPLTTTRKLLRESFPLEQLNQSGILCVEQSQRVTWLKELLEKLQLIERCSVRLVERGSSVYLSVRLTGVNSAARDDWFELRFLNIDDTEGLWISDASYRRATKLPAFAVCDVGQIQQFFNSVIARIDRDALKVKQNQKLANLKKTGLTARLKELGKQHGFSFAIGQSTRDVNLSIRVLGRKKAFHFAFPKTKLDAVIDQVPDLVAVLEQLQRLSVTFRTSNKNWADSQSDWIEPPEVTRKNTK